MQNRVQNIGRVELLSVRTNLLQECPLVLTKQRQRQTVKKASKMNLLIGTALIQALAQVR